MVRHYTVQRETLTNPHFSSFDKINFDELLDIALLLNIVKVLIWVVYIDWLNFGEFTLIR